MPFLGFGPLALREAALTGSANRKLRRRRDEQVTPGPDGEPSLTVTETHASNPRCLVEWVASLPETGNGLSRESYLSHRVDRNLNLKLDLTAVARPVAYDLASDAPVATLDPIEAGGGLWTDNNLVEAHGF